MEIRVGMASWISDCCASTKYVVTLYCIGVTLSYGSLGPLDKIWLVNIAAL